YLAPVPYTTRFRSFAGGPRARALVEQGLAHGWECGLRPIEQVFVYLPLEHAEDLACQDLAVERFAALSAPAPEAERELFAGYLDYAERHRQVIQRFGRFPHRNAILGRPSSAEEEVFLAGPGSRF